MIERALQPSFLDCRKRQIFVFLSRPTGARQCVIFVPPFAEEMNKCRRQTTEVALALNNLGYATLVLDLFGTGDSEGSFADANWDTWIDDLECVIDWVSNQELVVDTLIANRLGCILAASSLLQSGHSVARSVFVQPVEQGSKFMTQFLRLRVAASMMDAGPRESTQELRERLQNGETLEIAGYHLSPPLWKAIESLDIEEVLDACLGTLDVVEVSRFASNNPSASTERIFQSAKARELSAHCHTVVGEPFWSSGEIVVNHELTRLIAELLAKDLSS